MKTSKECLAVNVEEEKERVAFPINPPCTCLRRVPCVPMLIIKFCYLWKK